MARAVQDAIHTWARSLERTVLFPVYSDKTLSNQTRAELESYGYDLEAFGDSVTSGLLEFLEHRDGITSSSPLEMRQRHYVGYFKPRTYYANGGKSYRKARYLGRAFSDLCDLLESSNRYTCTKPERLYSREQDPLLIYDLTSFTSNLDVHSRFLSEMALSLEGYNTWIFSASTGLTQVSLSSLIRDMAEIHDEPLVDVSRVFESCPNVYAKPAGLLGVNGNIQTAKFIHASVMLQMVTHHDELNVAGDDGAIVSGNHPYSASRIIYLGPLEFSKCYSTSEDGSVCLKRPIQQIGCHFITSRILPLPNFEYPVSKDIVDVRYPRIAQLTKQERKKSAANSVTDSISHMWPEIRDLDFSDKYVSLIRYYYSYSGLPVDGNIPHCGNPSLPLVIPIATIHEDILDPRNQSIIDSYPGYAYLPVREKIEEDLESIYNQESDVFLNSSKYLKYMETLGYISREKQYHWVTGSEGLSALLIEFGRVKPPAVYRFTCHGLIPNCFRMSSF
jgi:hypothetical protein